MAEARLILDSGALSALAEGEPLALAWAKVATTKGMLLAIPAPVLAECTTGRASDARVNSVLRKLELGVIDTTAAIAREAGAIRFLANAPEKTVDALIVATSTFFPRSILLTSDPDDLTALASHRPDARLNVRSVNARP